MNKSSLRYVSTMLSVGVVSLALVQCSSSSSSSGVLADAGKDGSATTGAGGGTSGTGATTTTGTGGTGGTGGGGACPPSATDDACTTCIKGMCCTETNACATDANCVNLLMCVSNCVDDACAQNCATQNPAGLTALTPLINCTNSKCATPCM